MTVGAFRTRVVHWFQRTSNRRILGAILTVGAFSVLVKLAAMIKELVIAYRFGTADVIDAFLMAFLVPVLMVNVVTGSFSAAFTPVYTDVRERQGRVAAHALVGSSLVVSLVLASAVTVLLLATLPLLPLLAAGFDAEKLALTRSLFVILLPVLLLSAATSLWSAVLNCEDRFAWAALAPIGVPLVTLATIVWGAGLGGGYALALGTVLGYVLQGIVLVVALSRAGLPIMPRWHGFTTDLRRSALQYLPMIAGAVLANATWVIGQAMAATLPPGSVATLNYGSKIPAVTAEIGSMAIATAVFPYFARMVARREWQAIRHTLRVYGRLIAVVTIPLTLLAIYLSPTIVRLLFERGAFSAADTRIVAGVQSLLLLQIPFFMMGMLFVRLASSLQRNQILLWGAVIMLPTNVILNAVLVRWLGVAGIALATSVMYVVSCAYLFASVSRALRASERVEAGASG